MKLFNNVISAFVVLVIFLIIVPLPPVMLDLMFILNHAQSFVILITNKYIKYYL